MWKEVSKYFEGNFLSIDEVLYETETSSRYIKNFCSW